MMPTKLFYNPREPFGSAAADCPIGTSNVDADLAEATHRASAEEMLHRDHVVDLTDKLSPDGQLTWDVPEGEWTILRVGYTSTGTMNSNAANGGGGLDCDKLSRSALQAHWDGQLSRILANLGPLAGNVKAGLNTVLIDSYETGVQNWTEGFREEFKKRRGYDLLPFLAVFSGRVVDSPEVTERFMWDLRRTIADMFAENFSAAFTELAHKSGLTSLVEPYGDGPFDEMQMGRYADVPSSEFWFTPFGDAVWYSKPVSSIAHLYGRNIVRAESFTDGGICCRAYPYATKTLSDAVFCAGVNRLMLHAYVHQPWSDCRPGLVFGNWGSQFGRTITWWEESAAWFTYLSRCQYLLQQGRFVADVCFYSGENVPCAFRTLPLPAGYDYDGCPTEALMSMSVKDGRIVLPSGMSYRLLVLPQEKRMTPEVLKKIKSLVEAGATVIGPKPKKSPSLCGYPECDAQVGKLADELWTRISTQSPAEALAKMELKPDFERTDKKAKLKYIHRTLDDGELYFLANSDQQPHETVCTFRVSGKQPEFWHSDTGRIEPACDFAEKDGRIMVPMQFDPCGSVFVIFRNKTTGNGQPAANLQASRNFPSYVPLMSLSGSWQVQFDSKWGGPEKPVTFTDLSDWAVHSDPAIRYYSGTAIYRKEIEVGAMAAGTRVFFDLGDLKNIARVYLNGKEAGTAWKQPYRVEVSGLLRPGRNDLEIRSPTSG